MAKFDINSLMYYCTNIANNNITYEGIKELACLRLP